jgi:hypothetical protein
MRGSPTGRAKIFIAWEHGYARTFTSNIYKKFGGHSGTVPNWDENDYDSIFVVTIRRTPDGKATATFAHEQEGLDHPSVTMPGPAK